MTNTTADIVVIGGGVNGASVAMHLARIGAGRVLLVEKGHLAGGPTGRSGAIARVLGPFSREERETVDRSVSTTSEAIAYIITSGLDAAMSKYN